MGITVSQYSVLSSNEHLIKFCSSEIICPNDPFWNQMLAFNIKPPGSAEEQLMFDSAIESLLQTFVQNNLQTGNLGSLVQVFITRATLLLASPVSDNVMLSWTTFNALFVIKAVIKYLVEMVPEYELCRHLDAQIDRRTGNGQLDNKDASQTPSTPSSHEAHSQTPEVQQSPKLTASESRVEILIDALIGLIIDVPVTDNTYYLHLECINTLLVLMSIYMFAEVHGQERLVETSLIYRTLFQGRYGMHAPLLVKTLLLNLSSMLAAPPSMFGTHEGGSVLINLASGLWSMLSFTTSARPTIYSHPPADRQELLRRLNKEHPVANQSCLLLLALANHCMNDDNLYRRSLLCCEDSCETSSTTPQKDAVTSQITPPRIDMAALHRALCGAAGCEHVTLLLYLMLHSCRHYKSHVSATPHIENLIVPVLEVLYNAPENNSHHIYMSLIILLILTEDDALIKNVHMITLKNPTWYTERTISEISLGGLMVLVIIRALQYNMTRVRDKYLHTNCLAAVANMSCEFRNLHPYVAQRLISLFESLTKRRARLCSEIEGGDLNNLELPHQSEEKTEEIMDHINVLDEVLRMLLEIINSCLAHQLSNNLNLVYALLHKRNVFQQHQNLHITQNIEMVIGYFSSRLQRVQEGAGTDLGVTEVLACIRKGAEQWSSDRLKKFPDLKFRYVEEDKPEEFFSPYVWRLISGCGGVHWASEGGARALRHLLV
ncbi:dymeclin isoform X1 [Bombyx mandarina]|uniref:Dymeclin n=1 Tax=Bombyx mandarina TaxID=7092 RepID=A0A6J2JV86_BOMMA|nr:dymeclin isoform X1 [Bombyx mandarina]XP_028033751.1 dymeclin isoform X2 [Bombyx mandarina]XP_028033753.1 dymeclin isoform X1 [Bombyx mandarina]